MRGASSVACAWSIIGKHCVQVTHLAATLFYYIASEYVRSHAMPGVDMNHGHPGMQLLYDYLCVHKYELNLIASNWKQQNTCRLTTVVSRIGLQTLAYMSEIITTRT